MVATSFVVVFSFSVFVDDLNQQTATASKQFVSEDYKTAARAYRKYVRCARTLAETGILRVCVTLMAEDSADTMLLDSISWYEGNLAE